MPIFYAPEINPKLASYCLSKEESKHATQVLRLKAGEHIHIVDGKGGFFDTEITELSKNQCQVEIKKYTANYGQQPFQVNLAVAPTKNMDRFEFFLEKATEIGVDTIVPLLCKHSERKQIKEERLQRILIAAMKQSGKATLPQLAPLTPFADFINTPLEGNRLIAHCRAEDKGTLFDHKLTQTPATWILIGPEGDFSTQEIELALKHNFNPISLGTSRLRTETAAIVACSQINFIYQSL